MKKILLLITGLIAFMPMINAQQTRSEQEAYYLVGFARFLNFNNSADYFYINIVGQASVMDDVNELAIGNSFNGRKLLARETDSINMYKCSILFLNKRYQNNITNIINNTPDDVIVVAEDNPLADINFYYKKANQLDSSIVYSVNLQSIKRKKVKYSYEFIGLADKIIQ